MHIYFGADHGGYALKKYLLANLSSEELHITDCGTDSKDQPDDYPDFAADVAALVQRDPSGFGVLLCRSGEGMAMAAGKLPGIRAALVWQSTVARETRRDNDANILVLPSDFMSESEALRCLRVFIATPFSEEPRHVRRLQKLADLERPGHV